MDIYSQGSNLQQASIGSGNRLASRSWQTVIRSSDNALYWRIYASLAAMSFREYYHILCHFTLILCWYLLKIHRFLQCMRPLMLWFILVSMVLYIRSIGVTWLCNICCIYISLYLIIISVCWLCNVRRRRRATPYFFNINLPHTDDFVTRQLNSNSNSKFCIAIHTWGKQYT